jgi:maltose-binding protein MalE
MVSDDKTVPEFNLPIKSSTGQDQYVGTRALNFYTSFAQSNKEDYSWNTGMMNNLETFEKEKLIMTFAYPYEINTILQKNPSLKVKVIKTPQVKGTDEAMYYPSYWGETVSRNSKNSYAAWDFIKYISDDNSGVLSQFLNSTKRFSAKINDKFAPSYPQVGNYSLYVEQLDNAKSWYKGINPTKVTLALKSMITKVVTGKVEAQRAIDTAAADLRQYFQQVNQPESPSDNTNKTQPTL